MKKIFYVLIAAILVLPFTVSASNLLSNLEVEGIPPLSMTKSTYNLTLTSTLNYANIIATPAKEGVTVTGAGKIEVQEGTNALIVTATDGTTTETYRVNSEEQVEAILEEAKNDSNYTLVKYSSTYKERLSLL